MSAFRLDGDNLENTYNVKVERIKGNLDFLKRKGELSYDWSDEDGEEAFTDSNDIHFQARDIYLFCRIETDTEADFATKLNSLKAVLESAGLHTLFVPYPSEKVHTFFYTAGGAVDLLTRWKGNKAVGRFVLKLRESDPEVQ